MPARNTPDSDRRNLNQFTAFLFHQYGDAEAARNAASGRKLRRVGLLGLFGLLARQTGPEEVVDRCHDRPRHTVAPLV